MFKRLMLVTALVSVLSHTAAAQSYPPGVRPPVMPANALAVAAPAPAPAPALRPMGVPGLGANTLVPPAPVNEGGSGGVITRTAAAPVAAPEPHRSNRPKGMIAPPPPVIQLQSGVNATMGIAYAHTNRILTPFEHPEVKTNSTAAISVEGPIVYVSTNADDPISMFIHDHGQGDPAISLTLIPEEVPAVSTQVRLNGMESAGGGFGGGGGEWSGPKRAPAPASAELAHTFETTNPYVGTLVAIMKDLALQRVPDGYSFEPVHGFTPLMPTCVMPGLRIEPAQLLSGTEFTVIVARASNEGVSPVEVKEDGCGEGARAVGAWPDRVVRPGGSTELYLVIARPPVDDAGDQNVRPAVAGVR